ncbi:MAG: hypothetical protein R3B13_36870 [Polyangiaceae bacterium]
MNLTLVLVLVVIFSFGIGHLLTRYASRFVTLSGAEYILVGVLIGPHFPWKLVSEAALIQLTPLIALLLGLVGFVIGLRGAERERKLDVTLVGWVSAILVLLCVAAAAIPVLRWFVPVNEINADFVVNQLLFRGFGWVVEIHFASTHLWVALGIGASAAVASPLLLENMHRMTGAAGRVTLMLEATARSSQVLAVLVLGGVLATARATEAAGRFSMTVAEWELAAVGVGVVSGLLFGLFIGRESEPSRIFLATIGLVTFASGIGAALSISPLFVTMLAAVTVSVTSSHADRVREHVSRLQHALFVLLMIFAGALWDPVRGYAWLLPVGYVLVRFAVRRLATALCVKAFLEQPLLTRRLGNGLLSQGTLAVAIGVNFAQRFPEFASLILTTVLIGTILSDLFSTRMLRALLSDAGELGDELAAQPGPEAEAST